MKVCSKKRSKESGVILVEAAMIAPVLMMLIFFSVDLLIYSQGKTVVTQIARDGALYFATVPGVLATSSPSNPTTYSNVISNDGTPEWSQLCNNDYNTSDCPHLNTQIRIYRMLSGTRNFIDSDNSTISTSYDGTFVNVSVDSPVKTFFGFFSPNISKTIRLRRVNT